MLDAIIPLISLISLEVILGIDNVIFISILSDKLPDSQRNKLRYWGLGLAMVMRLILLTLISWILKLDQELFILFDIHFSGKGLILIAGGLFLIYKSTVEIYHKTEEEEEVLKKLYLYEKYMNGEKVNTGWINDSDFEKKDFKEKMIRYFIPML